MDGDRGITSGNYRDHDFNSVTAIRIVHGILGSVGDNHDIFHHWPLLIEERSVLPIVLFPTRRPIFNDS